MSTTRREALISIAALRASVSSGAAATTFLNKAELACVSALADAIIPRTETPGASDAGVPAYIEQRLSADAKIAEQFRKGLLLFQSESERQFGGGFASLDPQQQFALLTPISQNLKTPLGSFFQLVKELTVDGYYRSKEGLAQELGWHGNTFLSEFKGCTHPEHQG